MDAQELKLFIDFIKRNKVQRENRRDFHEYYEWLEGYWNVSELCINKKEKKFDVFCERFGEHYWAKPEFRRLVWPLAQLSPVGSSKNSTYHPTEEIMKASCFLKYRCEWNLDILKMVPHNDEVDTLAKQWNGSPFKAGLHLVRQVRNNLFHGRKMDVVDPDVIARNNALIHASKFITQFIVENLCDAEFEVKRNLDEVLNSFYAV